MLYFYEFWNSKNNWYTNAVICKEYVTLRAKLLAFVYNDLISKNNRKEDINSIAAKIIVDKNYNLIESQQEIYFLFHFFQNKLS